VKDPGVEQCDAGPYIDKVWNPSDDGIARTAGSHRAAGEFSAKTLAAVAVGFCVGDRGTRVIAGRGIDHESVGDEPGDGNGAGCGDDAEHNQTSFEHRWGSGSSVHGPSSAFERELISMTILQQHSW
jgi:hypothetical protein